ncbi:MAG: hypothetical protein RLZZ330_585 [Actinomycetota bacterium]|jgi:hypothetical protein
MKCSLCHTEVEVGTEFCPNCTANIVYEDALVKTDNSKAPKKGTRESKVNEPISGKTRNILIAVIALVVVVAGVLVYKFVFKPAGPENFASPAAVFEYLQVDCVVGTPQQGTDQTTQKAYTLVTCGQEYFALTFPTAEDSAASAAKASESMPDTYRMFTLANAIIVSNATSADALIGAHPDLVEVK